MEFSNTTDKNGILQNCESYCKLGDTGITGTATLKAKFTGWVNDAYGKVAMAILVADKNWRWDDSNYTTPNSTPVATRDLTDGQRDYILPRSTNTADQSTLWKVYKVRIKDSNGEWYDLKPLASDAPETEDGTGRPTHYRLIGNSIRLNDPPATGVVTLTAGIQVWFQREFDRFTSSDTTQQPGILSAYHYLLALDASATYLLPNNQQLTAGYIQLFNEGLAMITKSYATRNDDPQTTKRLVPFVEDTE